MTKRIAARFFCFWVGIMICHGVMLSSVLAVEDMPMLTDGEEYAVFVAVLFPKSPEGLNPAMQSDPEGKPYLIDRPDRLEGITGKSYNLSRFTISGAIAGRDGDQVMTADYNRRNEHSFRLDEERLLPLIPKGCQVELVSREEPRVTGDGIMAFDGKTSISRPGFNQDRTQAILQINHVAGPEMGVGYQVYLVKTSPGNWVIDGVVLNRRY